jgi:glycosyltransferase involved in cell wall biosynthesis
MGQDRIRVVYVLDNMRIGGTELNAVRVAERLDRERFDLRVVALNVDGPLAHRYESAQIPVRHMPISSLRGPDMVTAGLRLSRFLRDERVDVVHAHDMYSNVFAAPWSRLARVPAFIASRRWWHSLPNRQLRVGNSIAFQFAHLVVANSPAVAESIRKTDRVRAGRIRVIPNFVDDDAFVDLAPEERARHRRGFGFPEGSIVVGCVARLVPVKDHKSLLAAFSTVRAKHPRARLLIIGDGESAQGLKALSERLRIDDVVAFAGERLESFNLHQLFDLSVLCSLSEGFPNTLVEAMAAGRATVATRVGGSVDAVDDGRTGILVEPSAPERLAAALDRLLGDDELRERMGSAGRDCARRNFSARLVVPAIESLYLLAAGRSAA